MDPFPTWTETPDGHVAVRFSSRAGSDLREVTALLSLTGDDWVVGAEFAELGDAGICVSNGTSQSAEACCSYSDEYARMVISRLGVDNAIETLKTQVEVGIDASNELVSALLPVRRPAGGQQAT